MNYQQEVFNMLGGMHSPNTLPTIVSGQAFRIITRHPLHRDGIRIAIWKRTEQICGVESCEPSLVPSL
jgi:hypothetical protein